MMRLLILMLLCVNAALFPAWAHEGHEHADEAAPVSLPLSARLVHSSAQIEAVAQIDAQGLAIWVDDYASNRPLSGLDVSVKTGERVLRAKESEPGAYRLPGDLFSGSEVQLSIQIKGPAEAALIDERFAGRLPTSPLHEQEPEQSHAILSWIGIALAIVVVSLGLILILRRRAAARRG